MPNKNNTNKTKTTTTKKTSNPAKPKAQPAKHKAKAAKKLEAIKKANGPKVNTPGAPSGPVKYYDDVGKPKTNDASAKTNTGSGTQTLAMKHYDNALLYDVGLCGNVYTYGGGLLGNQYY